VPDWAAFVGLAGVLLLFLLALSRASQRLVSGDGPDDGFGRDPTEAEGSREEQSRIPPAVHTLDARTGPPPSTTALLVNVTVSQAVFGTLLAVGAWLTAIPPAALGLTGPLLEAVAVGSGLGAGLYLANELGAAGAKRLGIDHDESLRELLAPSSPAGWALLLGVALPVIAGFEELLFRAALVGVVSTAYPVSAWTMVAVSSVAFGLGHGAQGTGGVVVTMALGIVLGTAYVFTGSLVVVVVAHYLVNALEFVVHEGLDLEWAG